MNPERPFASLILAAGASSRMGRSKPLLPWRGSVLVRHVAEQALASRASMVTVVVGCERDGVRAAVEGLAVDVVDHAGWEEGLGSSLAAGARHLAAKDPPPVAVVVLLADQPFVTSATIDRLIEAHESTGRSLVACLHGSAPGVPALFAGPFLEPLSQLVGEFGARDVLRANAGDVAALDLPEASIDLDTPEDYERLR